MSHRKFHRIHTTVYWIMITSILLLNVQCLSAKTLLNASPKNHQHAAFEHYIAKMRLRASQAGVSQTTIDSYLPVTLQPCKKTLHAAHSIHIRELNTHKPKIISIAKSKAAVSKTEPDKVSNKHHRHHGMSARVRRFVKGYITRFEMQQANVQYYHYLPTLKRIQTKYQVPPQIVIAIWRLESNYGRLTGDYPLVSSLATLGFGKHRSEFFQQQLIASLQILDKYPEADAYIKSTFDGGLGQPQFEPTTYLNYAVDFDGDGFANIWQSKADTLASIANYLHQYGWHKSTSDKFVDNHNYAVLMKWNRNTEEAHAISAIAEHLPHTVHKKLITHSNSKHHHHNTHHTSKHKQPHG